jgi:hypothetical protein
VNLAVVLIGAVTIVAIVQIDRPTRSGRRLTQTFSIGNRGRRLMVVTELEREGSTRSFTPIYRRA